MDTLFPIPEQPSPRLAWIKRHEVRTEYAKGMPEPWSAWDGELIACIEAGGSDPKIGGYATGKTEDEALSNLAIGRGWKLWNEENPI